MQKLKDWLSLGLLMLIATVICFLVAQMNGKASAEDLHLLEKRQNGVQDTLMRMAEDIGEIKGYIAGYVDKDKGEP